MLGWLSLSSSCFLRKSTISGGRHAVANNIARHGSPANKVGETGGEEKGEGADKLIRSLLGM